MFLLDYAERAHACSDLSQLAALLDEVHELGLSTALGWPALGIEPSALPSFGGVRPELPSAFFGAWRTPGTEPHPGWLAARVLSWDEDSLLVAAAPDRRGYLLPRHPALLFDDERPDDDAAFLALASALRHDDAPVPLDYGLSEELYALASDAGPAVVLHARTTQSRIAELGRTHAVVGVARSMGELLSPNHPVRRHFRAKS